jgi:hypothetical protein
MYVKPSFLGFVSENSAVGTPVVDRTGNPITFNISENFLVSLLKKTQDHGRNLFSYWELKGEST